MDLRPGEGAGLGVSLTFGMVELSPTHADPQALFDAADQALYRGKQAGRNCLATG